MKKKQIVFEIDLQGNITSHIKGTKGKICADIAAELKKGLGTHIDESRTHEYYNNIIQSNITIHGEK